MPKQVVSLHLPEELYTRIAHVQGQSLLGGRRLSQQEILRTLLDRALCQVEKGEVKLLWKWVDELKK